jgi:hypothetical protein
MGPRVLRLDRVVRTDEVLRVCGAQKVRGSRLVSALLRYTCRAAHGFIADLTASILEVTAEAAAGVGTIPTAKRA